MDLLKKLRKPKDPKKLFSDSRHIIKHAFEIGKVDYYQFDDVFNLPYERGLMALQIYEECRMGVDREYLKTHVDAFNTALTAEKIDIFQLHKLNEQLREKMTFNHDANLLYKLASVVFFDKNENPINYELDYNARKIEFWKKNKDAADFFLQMPLKILIPFLNTSDEDLKMSLATAEEVRKIHSEVSQ